MDSKSLFVFEIGWLNFIKHAPDAKDMWDYIESPEVEEFLEYMNNHLSNSMDPIATREIDWTLIMEVDTEHKILTIVGDSTKDKENHKNFIVIKSNKLAKFIDDKKIYDLLNAVILHARKIGSSFMEEIEIDLDKSLSLIRRLASFKKSYWGIDFLSLRNYIHHKYERHPWRDIEPLDEFAQKLYVSFPQNFENYSTLFELEENYSTILELEDEKKSVKIITKARFDPLVYFDENENDKESVMYNNDIWIPFQNAISDLRKQRKGFIQELKFDIRSDTDIIIHRTYY